MKKKPYKYLKLYHEWMVDEKIPSNGLCNYFGQYLGCGRSIAYPEFSEFKYLIPIDGTTQRYSYWGFRPRGYVSSDEAVKFEFTPLRQNIVLLMAAMNGEL